MMAGSANSPETRVMAGLDHSELSEPEPGQFPHLRTGGTHVLLHGVVVKSSEDPGKVLSMGPNPWKSSGTQP